MSISLNEDQVDHERTGEAQSTQKKDLQNGNF